MLLKCTLVHTLDGMIVENTFGLESAEGTIPQDVADALGAVIPGSAWMTGRTDAISLVSIRVEDDTPGVAATGEFVLTVPEPGTDSGNCVPALCALVVQWKGLNKGKAGRGRMYLAGYPASTAIGSFWTSDAQDPASAAASVIFDAFGPSGSGQLTIINRMRDKVKLDPHEGTLVRSFAVDNVVRRIGRREARRGI